MGFIEYETKDKIFKLDLTLISTFPTEEMNAY